MSFAPDDDQSEPARGDPIETASTAAPIEQPTLAQASAIRRAIRALLVLAVAALTLLTIIYVYLLVYIDFSSDPPPRVLETNCDVIALLLWIVGCVVMFIPEARFAAIRVQCLAAAVATIVSAAFIDGEIGTNKPSWAVVAVPLLALTLSAIAWSRRAEASIYGALTVGFALAGLAANG
jgi:magnesium-transporting ATPase (P-type)